MRSDRRKASDGTGGDGDDPPIGRVAGGEMKAVAEAWVIGRLKQAEKLLDRFESEFDDCAPRDASLLRDYYRWTGDPHCRGGKVAIGCEPAYIYGFARFRDQCPRGTAMADLSRFNAEHLARFDREIQELRSWYDSATADEREDVIGWLSVLATVAERNPDRRRFTLSCRINNLKTDDEGTVVYNGIVFLAPKAMLAAVTAWDADAKFLPSHWMEIE